MAFLLLGTSRENTKSQNLSKDSAPGSLVARVTYPPKVMKLRRSTNMYRGWAGLNAGLVGKGPLTWLPLSDNLRKLQYQHDKAKRAALLWKARYDRFVALRKATRKARHAAKRFAALAHGQLTTTWLPLKSTIKEVRHQLANALRAENLWKARYIAHLRSLPRLTMKQFKLVVCSYSWSCYDALRTAWGESRYDRRAVNGQYHGYFQLSASIRSRYGIGEGFSAGKAIWAAFRNWVSANRHFCPQWEAACNVGIG